MERRIYGRVYGVALTIFRAPREGHTLPNPLESLPGPSVALLLELGDPPPKKP